MSSRWRRWRYISLVILLVACCVVPPVGSSGWGCALAGRATTEQDIASWNDQTAPQQACQGELTADEAPPVQPARLASSETAGNSLFEQETASLETALGECDSIASSTGQRLGQTATTFAAGQLSSLVTRHVRLQI